MYEIVGTAFIVKMRNFGRVRFISTELFNRECHNNRMQDSLEIIQYQLVLFFE